MDSSGNDNGDEKSQPQVPRSTPEEEMKKQDEGQSTSQRAVSSSEVAKTSQITTDVTVKVEENSETPETPENLSPFSSSPDYSPTRVGLPVRQIIESLGSSDENPETGGTMHTPENLSPFSSSPDNSSIRNTENELKGIQDSIANPSPRCTPEWNSIFLNNPHLNVLHFTPYTPGSSAVSESRNKDKSIPAFSDRNSEDDQYKRDHQKTHILRPESRDPIGTSDKQFGESTSVFSDFDNRSAFKFPSLCSHGEGSSRHQPEECTPVHNFPIHEASNPKPHSEKKESTEMHKRIIESEDTEKKSCKRPKLSPPAGDHHQEDQ